MGDDTTLPPEMLPRCPGAQVIVVCLCGQEWDAADHEQCPKCNYPNAPVN